RGAANDRRAHPGRAGVSRRAADREHGGRRRAHAGAAAERALPHGLCHGGVSDLAHLPVARAIENALADLKAGRPAGKDGVDFETFKDITSLAHWADVEQRAANSKK